ncbi:MAG: DUF86 domain-containing protein [bacterium]|nr:DUF86 domain-containing protein [bacterium]
MLEREDRERVLRILDFISTEIEDFEAKFTKVDFAVYSKDRDCRRNLERCIENIVNSSLDLAKIILITEDLLIPDTYAKYFLSLHTAGLINEEDALSLGQTVRLRNILAHEYLDIRWSSIKGFLHEGWKIHQRLAKVAKEYLDENNEKY